MVRTSLVSAGLQASLEEAIQAALLELVSLLPHLQPARKVCLGTRVSQISMLRDLHQPSMQHSSMCSDM